MAESAGQRTQKRAREASDEGGGETSGQAPTSAAAPPLSPSTQLSGALGPVSLSTAPTTADSLAVVLADPGISSVVEYKESLKNLTSEQQYTSLLELAHKFSNAQEKANEVALMVESIAVEFNLGDRMSKDQAAWEDVRAGAEKCRKSRDEKNEALSTIHSIWGKDVVDTSFGMLFGPDVGVTTLKTLRALAVEAKNSGHELDWVKKCVLHSQYSRLNKGGRGISTSKTIMPADLSNARKLMRDRTDPQLTDEQLAAVGCGVNRQGFICGLADTVGVSKRITELAEEGGVEEGGVGFHDSESRNKITESGRSGETEEGGPVADEDIDDVAARVTRARHRGGEDFDSAYDEGDTTGFDDDDVAEEEPAEEAEGERPAKRARLSAVKKHACGCLSTISLAFLTQVKASKQYNEAGKSAMIKNWKKAGGDTKMCHNHTKNLAGIMGIKTKALSQAMLVERLDKYLEATLNSKLGDLLEGNDTYEWFRRDSRPGRPDDRLGPYKFRHEVKSFSITKEQQIAMCAFLKIDVAAWERDGSINLPLFSWWGELPYEGDNEDLVGMTIHDVALKEFDMYDHHLRRIDGKPNYGWLRSMFHGLAQQAMRQDPVYLLAYAALRADQNTNLVSYPYYAKYQK